MILHVAGVELKPVTGMGRISFEWKLAFEKSGHHFVHIGPKEIGYVHPLIYGWHVRNYILKQKLKPRLILSHEPAAGFLDFKNVPLVVFSHGVEERGWYIQNKYAYFKPTWKSRCIPEFLRFYSNNRGFRKCAKALLSNTEDLTFLKSNKGISESKLQIFHNGYYPFKLTADNEKSGITFLYNATWIHRKGIELMYNTFNVILDKYKDVKLILAGTSMPDDEVIRGFQNSVLGQVKIIKSFSAQEEIDFYKAADIFVMPSFFEGQSLALTQAMAMGLCPLVSDNCGQKDFVQHQQNGLLFKTGDPNDMLEKTEWLLNNPSRISLMAQKARQSVLPLTWEYAANGVVDACESVL
jgi:glycosyltransferase involved in cell wall biosynthesis